MKAFLFTDCSDYQVYGVLLFKENVNAEEIQKMIWELNDEFYEHGDDTGLCQTEYVLNKLADRYDFEYIQTERNETYLYV